MKKLMFASAMFAAVTVAPFAANAAPKSGCPATPARWEKEFVDDVGHLIFSLGYGDTLEDAITIIQSYDRNGDGDVCLATRWEDLNPKSKHFGMSLYIVADNNANATK